MDPTTNETTEKKVTEKTKKHLIAANLNTKNHYRLMLPTNRQTIPIEVLKTNPLILTTIRRILPIVVECHPLKVTNFFVVCSLYI